MNVPIGSTTASSAGLAALGFTAGTGQRPPGMGGLGFNWDIFQDVVDVGLNAAKPLIAAGANRVSGGSVLPYDPNQWGGGGGWGSGTGPRGTGTFGGQVALGTNLSTGTLIALGVGGLVLVMLLTRGR